MRIAKTGAPISLPIPREMTDALACLPLPRGAARDCPKFSWSGSGPAQNAIGHVDKNLRAVIRKAGVPRRTRTVSRTRWLLNCRDSFEDVADVLGNSPATVRKHYARWSPGRQART